MINRPPPASGVFAAVAALCSGCVVIHAPSTADRLAVEQGEKAIVLLRVTAEMDQERIGPFDQDSTYNNVNLALGGFETGGELRRVDSPNAFSKEAYRDGWVYFILEPGAHYLKVSPPFFTSTTGRGEKPLWRFDVPLGSQVVYVGTLHLVCHGVSVLFSGRHIDRIDDVSVVDESALAQSLADEYLSEHPPARTALLRRHESGPIILTTPGL